MAKLIVYSSAGSASQILAANILRYKHPESTLKDLSGITTGNITSYIAGLTDNTYSDIFVACTNQTSGASSLLTNDQVAALVPKLLTANRGLVTSGTAASNSTVTNIVLATGSSAVNDAYKGMYITTAGTTAVSRYITGYAGATLIATVVSTTTAITTTETYSIYDPTAHLFLLGVTSTVTGKTAAALAWENCYPSTQYPLCVHYISGYLFAQASGTAAAVAAGTITLASAPSTGDRATVADFADDDYFAGKYVYVYSSTLGIGQYAKIASYVGTTQVCTLEANWTITPTGTVVYRVVDSIFSVNCDNATEVFVKYLMKDPSTASTIQMQSKLLDMYGELANGMVVDSVAQDESYLNDLISKATWAILAHNQGAI